VRLPSLFSFALPLNRAMYSVATLLFFFMKAAAWFPRLSIKPVCLLALLAASPLRSDTLEPLLAVCDDEATAYLWFCRLMARISRRFERKNDIDIQV
jgi:hypothetical protein